MNEKVLQKHDISVMIPEEKLQKRVCELAEQISKDYEGSYVKLICILKGSIFFTCELAKRITVPVMLDFMQVSSYGSGTASSGDIKIKKELDESIEDEHVIIVEDIIDSGNTLARLVPMLQERHPKSLKICTLLSKPDRREVDIDVEYNGFVIPDEFVVGYGLDYDQRYRNLPYIGVLKLKEQAEIEVILATLSASAAEYTDILSSDQSILTDLDVIFAKAQLSRFYKCSQPVMNTNGYINIKKGRHPLIDQHRVVPIDIYLGKDFNLLIVTGPNTGGKTVSLKTVGLLTLMAQSGLNIPALDHSEIAVFDNIFADIGDEQSIEQSLSTFSSHMTNTVNILKEADENSLILFDEIGAGTDPVEGAALAISILNDLHMRGITTMATTHYSEIKVYALTTDGVENACCEFDVESLRPTYRLLIGIPGKSNAFAISRKLGLPDYIIEDASSRMDSEDIRFEDLVSDLEHSRITIEKEREEINTYKSEIEQLKAQLKKKSDRLEERTDKIIRKANEEAASILRDAKEYADETIKTMNKHGMTVKELEHQRSALRDKMKKNQSKLAIKPEASTAKTRKSHNLCDFTVGTHVRVLSMNLDGVITSKPNNKGELTIQMGSLSTKTKINNLEILVNYKEPKEKTTAKGTGGSGKIKMRKSANISHEINLLGLTVDEATAKLDKYLDDAYLSGIPQVRIVHGKGTGALRNGVTSYLYGVPYIKSFRLGEIGEGDAGVTIVDFK